MFAVLDYVFLSLNIFIFINLKVGKSFNHYKLQCSFADLCSLRVSSGHNYAYKENTVKFIQPIFWLQKIK